MIGDGAVQGVALHADAVAVGDYRRRYDDVPAGAAPQGWGRLLALGSSFDYATRYLPIRWDRVMSVGIVGPMFELTASRSSFELRAKAAALYGFAQVTSLAYVDVASSLQAQFIRTVLREQGYYYAQALLPSAEVEARYGQFRLTLAGRGGENWSINHDDTHMSQITDGFSLRDARLLTAATLAVQPYCGPLRLALEFVSAFWDSSVLRRDGDRARRDHRRLRPGRSLSPRPPGPRGRRETMYSAAMRAAAGWLLWLAVAFGLYGAGLPRERFRAVEQRFGAGQWPGLVDAVRAYVTNDGDVRRYFAYAQAARGRPYQSYFVRTAEAWRRAFAAGEPYRPDAWPTVTPARPLVPYRDYLVEYPPGFFAAALPPAWLAADADAYVKWFAAFMALAMTGAFVLVARAVERGGGDRAPAVGPTMAWAALGLLLLGVVATHRFDATVALALAASAWAAAARRPIVLGVAVGSAIAIKLTPALVVPLYAMLAMRERRGRDLALAGAAAGLTILAFLLPALASAGGHMVDMLRYHADRPVQIESSWGALLGLVHAVAPGAAVVEKTFGSTNVAGPFGPAANRLATLATVSGLLAVYVFTWRRLARPGSAARARTTFAASAAVFAVFIACGKLSSPQYLVWILPLGLVLSLADGDRAGLVLFLAVLALTQIVYPIRYARLEALRPGPCALVLARNVGLLVWALRLLRREPVSRPAAT